MPPHKELLDNSCKATSTQSKQQQWHSLHSPMDNILTLSVWGMRPEKPSFLPRNRSVVAAVA